MFRRLIPVRTQQRTLNCRIILVHEVALDQLNGQARLADATTSYHHQLVLSEELRRARKSVIVNCR